MKRTASAHWTGNLKEGKGNLSTQSKALANVQYGFNTRFENGPGTNPEELIGAAHAGCFTMALAAHLGESGKTAEEINTSAEVTLEKIENNFTITEVHLDVTARIPGIDQKTFESMANETKDNCPVSKVLKAKITLTAKLAS